MLCPINLPSGKLTGCYWKWWFIVYFPIKNGDVPYMFLYVYQRVTAQNVLKTGLGQARKTPGFGETASKSRYVAVHLEKNANYSEAVTHRYIYIIIFIYIYIIIYIYIYVILYTYIQRVYIYIYYEFVKEYRLESHPPAFQARPPACGQHCRQLINLHLLLLANRALVWWIPSGNLT